MVSAVCQAKNPATCPYHGAVIRMYQAAEKGDLNAYFEERTKVEEIEKSKRSEEDILHEHGLDNLRSALGITSDKPTPRAPQYATSGPWDDGAWQERWEGGTLPRVAPAHDPSRFDTKKAYPYIVKPNGDSSEYSTLYVRGDMPMPAAYEADSVRIHLNRDFKDEDEREQIANIMKYKFAVNVRGESLGDWEEDGTEAITVFADFTKSQRSSLGVAVGEFTEDFSTWVEEGTPVRKKDNQRAVEGIGADGETEAHVYLGYSVRNDYLPELFSVQQGKKAAKAEEAWMLANGGFRY